MPRPVSTKPPSTTSQPFNDGTNDTFDPKAKSAQAFGAVVRGSTNAFEFSLAEIELRAMDLDPNLFADYEQEPREQRQAAA